MEAYQLVVLGLAAAASSVIKNGAAVGSGIFLLPVLALAFPPKIALGLGAPIMLASDLMGLRNYWREWGDWREIMRLILAATLGIVLGGYFVQVIPADLFKKGVGGFAVAFAAYHLLKDAGLLKRLLPDRAGQAGETSGGSVAASLVIGALGGVATVLAHAGGMVWSIYYAGRTMEKRCFVSTLIVLFALSNLVKLVTYVQIDILSLQSTLIVLAMSPVVVLGSNLGNVLNRKISQALFRRVVLLLILAVGANLALA